MANLVCRSALEEQDRSGFGASPAAATDRDAGSRNYEQPLIRAAVTIRWTAFGITRFDDHRSSLRALVSERDRESFAESKVSILSHDRNPAATDPYRYRHCY